MSPDRTDRTGRGDGAGHGLIVAVDGGGSKTDAVALDAAGTVLATARGESTSPHIVGLEAAVASIGALVRRLTAQAGVPTVRRAHVYLSGVDLPVEVEEIERALRGEAWVPAELVVENDLFAVLRAGTSEPDAVAVVCGTGINCVGVRADGETVRYASLGMISGDWGGGFGIGEWALYHAARAEDGRGRETTLRQAVPRALGLTRVQEVTEGLHFGRLSRTALAHLSPVVFAASAAGDGVAASIVDRQSEEIVTLAVTTLRRLELLGQSVPVVLGGGVIAGRDARLLGGIRRGLAAGAPLARIEIVASLPILGAALLALESDDAPSAALAAARSTLSLDTVLVGAGSLPPK